MTEPNRAEFLSYASQDAEAAQRICNMFYASPRDYRATTRSVYRGSTTAGSVQLPVVL